jgi:hypothetical protein
MSRFVRSGAVHCKLSKRKTPHKVGFVIRVVFARPASRELLAAQGWKRVRAELAACLATVGKSVGEGFLPSL